MVLNESYGVTKAKVMLFPHVCIKVALFYEFKLAFIAIKFFQASNVVQTVLSAKDQTNRIKGKVTLILHVCIKVALYSDLNWHSLQLNFFRLQRWSRLIKPIATRAR